MLIESCKYNEMIILNGRSFCHKDIGRNICTNSSVVDYVLSSLNTSKYFSYCNIAEFCELFADAHCPVEFSMKPDTNKKFDRPLNCSSKIKPWDENKKDNFNSNIDIDKVQCILSRLNSGNLNDKENVNQLMSEIENLFRDSAQTTFGTYTQKQKTKSDKKHQCWFNNRCCTGRQKYHLARKSYAKTKMIITKLHCPMVVKNIKYIKTK